MEISKPNENGCHAVGYREMVAQRGRSFAAIEIALCEDGQYRYFIELMYSYGGFCGPIRGDDPGFPSVAAAIEAGVIQLLDRWPNRFPSDPRSVHEELADLRRQVEARMCQPSLF